MTDLTLEQIARKYFDFGFKITQINKDREKTNEEDPFKSPIFEHWKDFTLREQNIFDNWWNEYDDVSGIGTVLGSQLRCIDIDGCTDCEFLQDILNILGLPIDYEWVVKTGSGKGFHIIIKCETHNFPVSWAKVKSFFSNGFREFERMELRWFGHLVLPPSLHSSGNQYEFLNSDFPANKPLKIDENKIDFVVSKYCSDNNLAGSSGLYLDHGPSYISKEISMIHDDLSIAFKPAIKLVFAIKTNDYDHIIKAISWILIDSDNKLIEYCNYFVNPKKYSTWWTLPYYDLSQESNIASLNDVGVNVKDVLIAFKNRIELSDECYYLNDYNDLGYKPMDNHFYTNTKEKILFYFKAFGLSFKQELFRKFRENETLSEMNGIPMKNLRFHENSFLKPVFDKIIKVLQLSR